MTLDSPRRPRAQGAAYPAPDGLPPGSGGSAWGKLTDTLTIGCGLLIIAGIGGLYFSLRPKSQRLDHWIGYVIPLSRSGWLTGVTWLRYPVVVVVGSALCAVLCFSRDRLRAFACLVGPPLALALCELVAKPLVGRTLGGSLSYPSGSTVGAAALATAVVLAAPLRWRWASVIVSVAYVVWMAFAVVSLQWHYPTDALGGLAFGAGVVLVVDGLLRHLLRGKSGLAGRNGDDPEIAPNGSAG